MKTVHASERSRTAVSYRSDDAVTVDPLRKLVKFWAPPLEESGDSFAVGECYARSRFAIFDWAAREL